MPTDLEIAQAAQPKRIQEIAEKAGIPEGAISPYGQYIAKVDPMPVSYTHLTLPTIYSV